jgi:hypothetical protein
MPNALYQWIEKQGKRDYTYRTQILLLATALYKERMQVSVARRPRGCSHVTPPPPKKNKKNKIK